MKNRVVVGGVAFTKRKIISLSEEDRGKLAVFISSGNGAYSTITLNTGLAYMTIRRVSNSGKGEADVIKRLKEFLASINTTS